MHIAEVVTIAKSLPLLRLNTYKSLILSYSADYRRIFKEKYAKYYQPSFLEEFKAAKDAAQKLNLINVWANAKSIQLYLIIDEYDNFTKTVWTQTQRCSIRIW